MEKQVTTEIVLISMVEAILCCVELMKDREANYSCVIKWPPVSGTGDSEECSLWGGGGRLVWGAVRVSVRFVCCEKEMDFWARGLLDLLSDVCGWAVASGDVPMFGKVDWI